MERILSYIAVILMAVVCASCSQPDELMSWTYSDYDSQEVSIEYNPQCYQQFAITTNANYSGSVVLHCKNFSNIQESNSGLPGPSTCSIEKIDSNSIKINFSPIKDMPSDTIQEIILLTGEKKKQPGSTSVHIYRIK